MTPRYYFHQVTLPDGRKATAVVTKASKCPPDCRHNPWEPRDTNPPKPEPAPALEQLRNQPTDPQLDLFNTAQDTAA